MAKKRKAPPKRVGTIWLFQSNHWSVCTNNGRQCKILSKSIEASSAYSCWDYHVRFDDGTEALVMDHELSKSNAKPRP